MKQSVDIIGQSVFSITEGKEFGQVKELLVDCTSNSIVALIVDDRKWYKLLPFQSVAGLGEFAVTINSSKDILSASGMEFERLLDGSVRVLGTRVITKSGKIQGKISKLLINEAGKINVCEVLTSDGRTIKFSINDVITFGAEVVVIADNGAAPSAALMATPNTTAAKPTMMISNHNLSSSSLIRVSGKMASANVGMPAPQVVKPVVKSTLEVSKPVAVQPSPVIAADVKRQDDLEDDKADSPEVLQSKEEAERERIARTDSAIGKIRSRSRIADTLDEFVKAPQLEGCLR